MKLGTVTLPGCTITGISPTAKQAIHDYDWSDECAITDMGSGPTTLSVSGIMSTEDERNDVIGACEDARTTETNLYFASIIGASDDHYYRVYTGPCQLTPVTATVYHYSFSAIAVVPYVYDAATDLRVT